MDGGSTTVSSLSVLLGGALMVQVVVCPVSGMLVQVVCPVNRKFLKVVVPLNKKY